jgi:hypothetical protein
VSGRREVPGAAGRPPGYPATIVAVSFTRAVAWTALLVAAAGCNRAWRVETTQPPLALGADLDARTSLPGTIELGDMELPDIFRLSNSAYFVAVSRDRLRFHVTLLHKWQEIADPSRWRVWMVDDLGHRFAPEDVDLRRLRPVTTVFDPGYSGSVNTRPLYSMIVYRGEGDFVFHRRDLLRKDMRWLMLVMVRPGYEYRYVWSFADDADLTGAQSATKSIVPNRLSI